MAPMRPVIPVIKTFTVISLETDSLQCKDKGNGHPHPHRRIVLNGRVKAPLQTGLLDGLVMQAFVDPDAVSPDVVVDAVQTIAVSIFTGGTGK